MTGMGLRRSIGCLCGTAIAAALTAGAGAFGDSGHRVIGHLAELHLQNSRALGEVRKILRTNESLADAAVWPDTIKTPTYEDEDTATLRLEHPAQDVYHYANLPFQADRYAPSVPGARPSDVLQMTRECIRVLQGSSDAFTRREAVRFLAHLVGDLHQPLHVGTAYVSAGQPLRFVLPEGPAGWRMAIGGNALRYGPRDIYNLHSYWDTHAVNLVVQKQDPAVYAARLRKEMPVASAWSNAGDPAAWPELWVNEALAYARDAHQGITVTAYLGPDAERQIPHRWRIALPPDYDDRARPRVRTQLAKGGYRLAALLKAIWP